MVLLIRVWYFRRAMISGLRLRSLRLRSDAFRCPHALACGGDTFYSVMKDFAEKKGSFYVYEALVFCKNVYENM